MITGLPEFEAGEVLTAAVLNTIKTVVEAKFAGNVTDEDLLWPLLCNGNLDMSGYGISGLRRMQNMISVSDRGAWQSVQALFDSVSASGGGVLKFRANTTTASQLREDGTRYISLGSNMELNGDGVASICGALRAENQSNIYIHDMTLNGENKFTNVDNLVFEDVVFSSAGTACVSLTKVSRVTFLHCKFTGTANYQMQVDGASEITIDYNTFINWTEQAIFFSETTKNVSEHITLRYNTFLHPATYTGSATACVSIWTPPWTGQECTLEGNTYTGNGLGVRIQQVHRTVIDGEHVDQDATTHPAYVILGTAFVPYGSSAFNHSQSAVLYSSVSSCIIDTLNDGIILGRKQGTETTFASRLTAGAALMNNIEDNLIYSNAGAGIVASAQSQTGFSRGELSLSNDHEGWHPVLEMGFGSICGNNIDTASASFAALEFWDNGARTGAVFARRTLHLTVMGNRFESGLATAVTTYGAAGVGSLQFGALGALPRTDSSQAAWLIFVGNTASGTTISGTLSTAVFLQSSTTLKVETDKNNV